MTKKEYEVVAEKIMGWHIGRGETKFSDAYYSGSKYIMEKIKWIPDINIKQAFMISDKMESMGFDMKFGTTSPLKTYFCEFCKYISDRFIEGRSVSHFRAKVISEAALKAFEDMNNPK